MTEMPDLCPYCHAQRPFRPDLHGWGCPAGPSAKVKRFRRDVRAALEHEGGWHVAQELAPVVNAPVACVAVALRALVEAGLVDKHPASATHYKIKPRRTP